MKMTVEQLLNKIETDDKFAKQLKVLTDQCCKDRDALIKVGVGNKAAAQAYLASWGKFFTKFAFDPISLAALSLPKVRYRQQPCRTKTGLYTILTDTQVQELYEQRKSRPRPGGTKAKPKAVATKKKKASK